MLSLVKNLFGIQDLDDEDESQLEKDVHELNSVVNSSKYADSNSDTAHIERIFSALKVKEVPAPPSTDPSTNKPNVPTETDYSQMLNLGKKFSEKLTAHLDLLFELEGEAQKSYLTGPPVFEKAKFGKQGGSNFVLRRFSVPRYIYDILIHGPAAIVGRLKLTAPLSMDDYVEKFQNLYWLEEAHQSVEMHRYDMHSVMLATYERNFFLLEVPGLAEGRPSLMRGDKLIVQSSKRNSYYEGYIFEVRERDIIFKLHENIHAQGVDGLRFDVSFLLSRTAFRRGHHGILQFKENPLIKDIIFPSVCERSNAPLVNITEETQENFRLFVKQLNTYQRKAVINILKATCRPAPYIIFGPPGTGKTQTLVEAVMQVYARKPGSKILVCANSNAAVDLIALRVKELKVVPIETMVRVSAFYRMEKMIPPELEDITLDMEMLTASSYRDCRIVFTTCVQAGALNEFLDKFDYLFIDEAGHANEPETLIAASLIHKNGCIVMAGDPYQLGPVCISDIARVNGLGISLLERLCGRAIYQRRIINSKMAYDERYITKLLISYRSDPRVLSVSNKLFYHDELKCRNKTPKKWMDLLKVNHPLVFHSVKGKDRREYATPSWFNPNEAIICIGYVNRLYKAGLKAEELGIITPYRRQIDKLDSLFKSLRLEPCKIATMEEFQGDEREVIIISTVRTREKNLEKDKQFNLGFLFNEKRFNVAVSRAKWLVIVVGDPAILLRDRCWIEYTKTAHMIEGKSQNDKKT